MNDETYYHHILIWLLNINTKQTCVEHWDKCTLLLDNKQLLKICKHFKRQDHTKQSEIKNIQLGASNSLHLSPCYITEHSVQT